MVSKKRNPNGKFLFGFTIHVGSTPFHKPSPSHHHVYGWYSMFAIHKSIGLDYWLSHITLYIYIYTYICMYTYIYVYVIIYTVYIYILILGGKKTLKPSPDAKFIVVLNALPAIPSHPVGIEKQSDGAHAPLPGHFLCLIFFSTRVSTRQHVWFRGVLI